MSSINRIPNDPFLLHLISLLSAYELQSTPPPRYDGPSDWQTNSILRALAVIARRMSTAENALASIKTSRVAEPANSSLSDLIPSSSNAAHGSADDVADGDMVAEAVIVQNMSLSNDDTPNNVDPFRLQPSLPSSSASVPSTSRAESMSCPTCGKTITDTITMSRMTGSFNGSLSDSPLVVPPGSLASAAFESDMSAVEELRLLKAQVSDVARVCNAVARGDLSQKVTVPVQGLVMVQLKDVINTMVDKLGQFAKEVARVSREVGTEGKLNEEAFDLNVEGTWRELTGAVNNLAANFINQVRGIADVTKAVALGDLSKLIVGEARGEMLDLKFTINEMVIRLRGLATEVNRVTLEVGSQGKLGGQAHIPDVEGVWFELVCNVNRMCSSLTDQVRSIAQVTTAVAKGDLTQKIEVKAQGEVLALNDTVNSMVEQLNTFASEVARVALEVGTQGILGGQARVEGAQGAWADLTLNVNKMAGNLTDQVRSISEVTKAVTFGDFSKVVDVKLQGEMLDLKMSVNSMVAQLSMLANEIIRVSLEVRMEGILGGQVSVPYARGMWKVLTYNFNSTTMDLARQVRSIAEVAKAVAAGDFTKKIEVDARGEIKELKETMNGMTESLGLFADEVTRVVRDLGTDGRLGVQARVDNVDGRWKDVVDEVNLMAANLTLQVGAITVAMTAVARGDLTQRITGVTVSGEMRLLADTINTVITELATFAEQVRKAAFEVRTGGKPGVQAKVGNARGVWQEIITSVDNITAQSEANINPQQSSAQNSYFAWFYNLQRTISQSSLLMVGIVLAGVMLWLSPFTLLSYISVGWFSLIAAFLALAIVRLIFYVITIVFIPPGIWIFPNFLADVGLIETFTPLWEWDIPKNLEGEKKKGKSPMRNLAQEKVDDKGGTFMEKVARPLMVVIVLAGVMFSLSPHVMWLGVVCIITVMFGLTMAFTALAIVRLIFYAITIVLVPPGIWIFPRLLADVRVIESFTPLWEWDMNLEGEKKKKESKKRN